MRYDGDHKRDALVSDTLQPWFEVVRLCPEVAIGLPVPRPPIQVVTLTSGPRVRRVDDPSLDFTTALRNYAGSLDTPVDGYILKARSPSCGVGTTPVHDAHGAEMHARGNGAFADALLARRLAAPVVNESHLQEHADQALFLLQIHLHCALRAQPPVRTWHDTGDWLQRCEQLPAGIGTRLADWLRRLAPSDTTVPMLQLPQADSGVP